MGGRSTGSEADGALGTTHVRAAVLTGVVVRCGVLRAIPWVVIPVRARSVMTMVSRVAVLTMMGRELVPVAMTVMSLLVRGVVVVRGAVEADPVLVFMKRTCCVLVGDSCYNCTRIKHCCKSSTAQPACTAHKWTGRLVG